MIALVAYMLEPTLWVGLSKQPEDSAKPTRPNPSRPNSTPPTVGDGSYLLKPDSGRSSSGFWSLKPEPLDPTNKCLKKCQNYLDPATIWCFLAPIRPLLVFLHLDPVVFAQIHLYLAKIYSPPSSDFAQIRRYMVRSDLNWRR